MQGCVTIIATPLPLPPAAKPFTTSPKTLWGRGVHPSQTSHLSQQGLPVFRGGSRTRLSASAQIRARAPNGFICIQSLALVQAGSKGGDRWGVGRVQGVSLNVMEIPLTCLGQSPVTFHPHRRPSQPNQVEPPGIWRGKSPGTTPLNSNEVQAPATLFFSYLKLLLLIIMLGNSKNSDLLVKQGTLIL